MQEERKMTALMILYASAIPLVPLWGAGYFRKKKQRGKQAVCMALFLSQLLISGAAIYMRFFA